MLANLFLMQLNEVEFPNNSRNLYSPSVQDLTGMIIQGMGNVA